MSKKPSASESRQFAKDLAEDMINGPGSALLKENAALTAEVAEKTKLFEMSVVLLKTRDQELEAAQAEIERLSKLALQNLNDEIASSAILTIMAEALVKISHAELTNKTVTGSPPCFISPESLIEIAKDALVEHEAFLKNKS